MLTFGKDAVKLVTLRKLLRIEKGTQNRKSCSKVAEQNLSGPIPPGGRGGDSYMIRMGCSLHLSEVKRKWFWYLSGCSASKG